MRIDLNKAADAANNLRVLGNQKLNECLGNLKSILSNIDSNDKVDEMLQTLGKMEQAYNTEYLPVFQGMEKVLTQQLPELEQAMKSLSVDSFTKKAANVTVKGIDIGQVKLN